MDDGLRELYAELQRSMSQFIYFLLGAAGASIAFAVHQTAGKPLVPTMAPLGLAVLCWALSFFCGLVALQRRQHLINLNFKINQLKHHSFAIHPNADVVLAEEFKAAAKQLDEASEKPSPWMTAQRWCLFLGAIAYLAGHVLQMAQVPVSATA